MNYQPTPLHSVHPAILATLRQAAAKRPAGPAEDHMCQCHHSPGAHKKREPHACGLCTCNQYRDSSNAAATASPQPLTDDAKRALDTLAHNPTFKGVTQDHLRRLAACSRRRLVLAGTVLMTEGIASDRLYVLVRGAVRVEKGIDDLVPRTLARLGPGELVGEMGILRNTPLSVTVIAEEDLELLEVSADDLKAVFREDPLLLMAFAKVMHERLQLSNTRGAAP